LKRAREYCPSSETQLLDEVLQDSAGVQRVKALRVALAEESARTRH
jgi:hypothetical protein